MFFKNIWFVFSVSKVMHFDFTKNYIRHETDKLRYCFFVCPVYKLFMISIVKLSGNIKNILK